MCSVAPKTEIVLYVDSKGDVKEFFWLAVWAVFGSCSDGVWVFFASAVSSWCLHRLGMCSVAPKIVFFVDSKGDVKEFFGLRFGRFSARVQMVFASFCICSVYMVFA